MFTNNSSERPPVFYGSTRTLAGKQKKYPTNTSALKEFYKDHEGIYDTAKNIKLKCSDKLPWQYDTQGRLFSTPSDERDFKIKFLQTKLGLVEDEKTGKLKRMTYEQASELPRPAFKPYTVLFPATGLKPGPKDEIICKDVDCVTEALITATANELAKLESERALQAEEASFRKGLMKWILGHGTTKEYEPCWWVDKDKDQDQERKKIIDNYPGITRGIIHQIDTLPSKAKLFLQELARKVPRTQEEAYLWYKYFIVGAKINFDYVITDELRAYSDQGQEEAMPTEQEKAVKRLEVLRSATDAVENAVVNFPTQGSILERRKKIFDQLSEPLSKLDNGEEVDAFLKGAKQQKAETQDRNAHEVLSIVEEVLSRRVKPPISGDANLSTHVSDKLIINTFRSRAS